MSALTDAELDAFEPEWTAAGDRFDLRARAPGGARPAQLVVQNATTVHDIGDLRLLASAFTGDGDATRATDAGGIAVSGETVEVWDGGGNTATASRRGMAEVFARLTETAARHADDPALVELAAALRLTAR